MVELLIGKKVLIFDTETTGLPAKKPGGKFGTRSEYYSPKFNSAAYDKSRIVSIAWFYTDNFKYNTLDTTKIKHCIRKPEGFSEIPTTYIHGISYDDACVNGMSFKDILKNTGLELNLMECDYIVAHNILFDIHILINELYVSGELIIANKMDNMLDNCQCICTGEIGRQICKLGFKNSRIETAQGVPIKCPRYKMPKLSEFYYHIFTREIENAHSADGDVKALMDILKVITMDYDDDDDGGGDCGGNDHTTIMAIDTLSKI